MRKTPRACRLPQRKKRFTTNMLHRSKQNLSELHAELEKRGIEVDKDVDNHTPRYVSGRTRSFGEVLDKWKQGVESKFQGGAAARSMRQTVDAQKSRRFYKAVSPDGEEVVVHVGKDGRISGFDGSGDNATPDFAKFPAGQKLGTGAKIKVSPRRDRPGGWSRRRPKRSRRSLATRAL